MDPRDPCPVTVRTIRLTISKRPLMKPKLPREPATSVGPTQVKAARDQHRLRAPDLCLRANGPNIESNTSAKSSSASLFDNELTAGESEHGQR